jgi:ketosteroid isomerase-like protein
MPHDRMVLLRQMAGNYPHVVEIALRASHHEQSVVGPGCDEQFEFELTLDLLLDGFERLHLQGWSSTNQADGGRSRCLEVIARHPLIGYERSCLVDRPPVPTAERLAGKAAACHHERMGDAAEHVVRRFYQAVADLDFDAAERCFAPDALWHLPGRSPIAGDHRGWSQIRDDFLAKLGPLSGGTFRAELLDVAVGDTYVVAVQRATASRGQHRLDITGCQLILVSNGAIQTVRGHYSDQNALDAFWVE